MSDTASNPATDSTGDDYEAARRQKLARIAATGADPWGQRLDDRDFIGTVRGRASEIRYVTEDGTAHVVPDPTDNPGLDLRAWKTETGKGEMTGPTVRVAGRVVLRRDKGKLHFVDIRDWTGSLQLFISQKQVGETGWEIANCLDLGDLVAAEGTLFFTNTGELSVMVDRLTFLTKSLETPPDKHKGLADPELRQRRRYVDLAYEPETLARFLERSKIVQSVRSTLAAQHFVEIEGPTLHGIAGGAAARPFVTHHNALDIKLFLRIALELHLKRVMVGGIERVFELGRVYRNEGLSPKHNPEFTMLEVYQAYGDYGSMMDLTEAIIGDALAVVGRGPNLTWNEKAIDFSTPFRRAKYHDLVAEHAGVDPADPSAVSAKAVELGLEVAGAHPDVILNAVFEETVESHLIDPTFVIDYPAAICPLTKRKRDNPDIAERFELFIAGMEVANAYTELNDPDLQESLFRQQLAGQSEEDSMAKMDYDFVRALRYGMPPAGGLGIGIDRLVMLLTGATTIREVILFPTMRPE